MANAHFAGPHFLKGERSTAFTQLQLAITEDQPEPTGLPMSKRAEAHAPFLRDNCCFDSFTDSFKVAVSSLASRGNWMTFRFDCDKKDVA